MGQFVYIWEYIVNEESLTAFENAYGPEGAWVQLFKQHPDYLRTELFQDESDQRRYVTVDYWKSRTAWDDFKGRFEAEYQVTDDKYEAFTQSESFIGNFQLASDRRKD